MLVRLSLLLGSLYHSSGAWNPHAVRQGQRRHHQQPLPSVLIESPAVEEQELQRYTWRNERRIPAHQKGSRTESKSTITRPTSNPILPNARIAIIPLGEKVEKEDERQQRPGDEADSSYSSTPFILPLSLSSRFVDQSSPALAAAAADTDSQQEAIWKPPKLRYYSILGVESTATCQQIKIHYRKLAKIYHPDANPHRDTTEAFSLLNRAYEVLMHPELRHRYDLYGKQGVGTSALSDSEKIDQSTIAAHQPKDWTQVVVEPFKTVVVMMNQTHTHGDNQDVKWRKEPPPYEESLVKYQHSAVALKQAVNEERTYGHVVQDYQSLANTNWETCMKNSMDETKFVRPKHAQRCLYSVLGIPPQATAEQLQQAFAVATEDYSPTMDLAVGNNRRIYAHYHQLKKAYDVLKIPALRQKYNQYGFEGLSHLRYAQAKVTNRYASNLCEGWDPDGPAPSKVPIGMGARVLNSFCAPNMAAMSFDTSGVEYKSIGELGSVVATRPGPNHWTDNDTDENMSTVLTGRGASIMGTSSSSSAKSKRRQKFFTISPLPIGTHFQAAGPIPLEDLFEIELENSDGSDDELFMKEVNSPIIAGPVGSSGGAVHFAPLSDLQPIRFQDGASLSVNGRGGSSMTGSRGSNVLGVTDMNMAPLISNMPPIIFQNVASVSVSGNGLVGGTSDKYTLFKSQTKSTDDEPIPWPLSNVENSPIMSSQASSPSPQPAQSLHPVVVSIPSPRASRATLSLTTQAKQKRRKFFTIAPLPLGKSYQRAPKLSCEELFEEYHSVDESATDESMFQEMERTNDHAVSNTLIPFPNLESVPKQSKTKRNSIPTLYSSASATLGSPPNDPRGVVATCPGISYKDTGATSTTGSIRYEPMMMSTTSTANQKKHNVPIQKFRLYTIAPLPIGQSYTRAPCVDRSKIFNRVLPQGGEETDVNDGAVLLVHAIQSGKETTFVPTIRQSDQVGPSSLSPIDYSALLDKATTDKTEPAGRTTSDIVVASALDAKTASTVPGSSTSSIAIAVAATISKTTHAPKMVESDRKPVLPSTRRQTTAHAGSVPNQNFIQPSLSTMVPKNLHETRNNGLSLSTNRKQGVLETKSNSIIDHQRRMWFPSTTFSSANIPAIKKAVVTTLRSQQDEKSWSKDVERRLAAQPIPAKVFFSKSACNWMRRGSAPTPHEE